MLTSTPTRRLFLRQWRHHRDLTQEKLADLIGVTQGMISHLENGQSDYTGDLLERLARALKCDPVHLFYDPLKPEDMWILWEQAKPTQRRQIEEVAKALLKMGAE